MGELVDGQHNELENIDIKNWVTKSNELIESTYKLSLQEQRILLVMASKVQPNDETLKTYRFRARDFIEIIGNKKGTGFYSYLKEIVNGLQSKVLTIKEDGKQRNYNWVITSIYEDKEGYITLQFHPKLKYLFLELKEKFTTYQLENVVRLNSVYSIRIYELLKQYERLKKRQFTIEEIRKLLAIEPDKYKQYGHFKSKVLLVAQSEINEKTDIEFIFTEIKTGRKVTSIEFLINSKVLKRLKELGDQVDLKGKSVKQSIGNLPETNSLFQESKGLREKLIELGVEKSKLEWLLNEFTQDRIERNVNYVTERLKTSQITHTGSYTVKAIQQDYGNVIENNRIQNQKTTKKPIRSEVIPEWMKKNQAEKEIMENGSTEKKQQLYFEKRGSQEEFEDFLLKTKEIKIKLNKRDKNKKSPEELDESIKKSIIEAIKNDIKERQEVGLKPQLINDFKNLELQDIYQNLLLEQLSLSI
ncbi:RepB family plasmid replication initiator protein [Metabacillus idriensis]|uniref:replication initiation protein n=1 Tax=Metabacillus idriensis TaxID=324768 RepID=UPI0008A945B9|nr:replication initiation protein [Metabacillus idriensis]MCM3597915.1 RepB family plasmid replication initiator protein [Metabacillus idriensis]OHR73608.1 replication initiation protein [Bacillus sp. HMSC76G11]